MSEGTTRKRFAVATDAFVMDSLRRAREYGIREERERVLAFLRIYKTPMTDGQWFADEIENGKHDAGRTFPPLGDANGSTKQVRVGAKE